MSQINDDSFDSDRRHFLQIMAASFALAGVSACTRMPMQKILSRARSTESALIGKPLFYSSNLTFDGYAYGIQVETHEGRPTKIEGASEGSNPRMQASVLSFYDPDRMSGVLKHGQPSTWDAFFSQLISKQAVWSASKGNGLRILSRSSTSPTFQSQLHLLSKKYPLSKVCFYDPIDHQAEKEASIAAFHELCTPIYHFDRANIILSLDSNFLADDPGHLRYAHDFIQTHRVRSRVEKMSRLYVIEPCPTITGATADHRLAISSSDLSPLTTVIARQLGIAFKQPESSRESRLLEKNSDWIRALLTDLKSNPGKSLVIPGRFQSKTLHLLTNAINAKLQNFGSTIQWIQTPLLNTDLTLQQLTQEMREDQIKFLLILGGNPVYDAPVDLSFSTALKKVPFKAHLSLNPDETSNLCDWHLPQTHDLESWGDARAFDGTVSLVQPASIPLHFEKSPIELINFLLEEPGLSGRETLRQSWSHLTEVEWKNALLNGVISKTEFKPAQETSLPFSHYQKTIFDFGLDISSTSNHHYSDYIELNFRPDPVIWDGQYANNAWLQELPKPIIQLTWDNAAFLAPSTAKRLNLAQGEWIQITLKNRSIEIPVFILFGHAENSITLPLGFGRTHAGRVGNAVGVNVYPIRTTVDFYHSKEATVRKIPSEKNKLHEFALTQRYFKMEGRDFVRTTTLDQLRENSATITRQPKHRITVLEPFPYIDNKWGMSIDLGSCISCMACVVACQSENNIAVVGKDQVLRGRHMHWLRVDSYFEGPESTSTSLFQPVPCMHCETAPCEIVCPTAATVHSTEGLNQMVYNRCIGTRYCSNNCPYKVRRFNFYDYTKNYGSYLAGFNNPEVTVRSRGVMEKCTYCIQRIEHARIEASKENRKIRDGEVKTACQTACPTEAIIFGNLNDPDALVTKLKSNPLNYELLGELNTSPRTTYLARVFNPSQELRKNALERGTE